jgi:hypothetical protein
VPPATLPLTLKPVVESVASVVTEQIVTAFEIGYRQGWADALAKAIDEVKAFAARAKGAAGTLT